MSAPATALRSPGATVLPFRSPRLRAGTVSSFDLVRAFWEARDILPYDTFKRLTGGLKALSFSTAFNFENDVLRTLLEELEHVRGYGGDVKDFRDLMKSTLNEFGMSFDDIPAARVQLIYQQQTTNAANGGLYAESFSAEGMAAAEIWEFHAARETVEEHPEEVCALLDGKLFWKDDAWAYRFLPQLHFRCRCYIISRQYEEGMQVEGQVPANARPQEQFNVDKLAPLTGIYGPLGGGA